MAIFKKNSPLEGNPCTAQGKMLEFKDGYFETAKEDEIEFLKTFSVYTEVESREEVVEAKPVVQKAATGTISAADLSKIAAANK